MHIGEKIKRIRSGKGLTQEKLASKVNLTRSMISHIEQTGKVNHYTLVAIVKALNITEKYLHNFDDSHFSANENDSTVEFNKTETELLRQKLERMQNEIKVLKDLIKSQKKIIHMLERKRKK